MGQNFAQPILPTNTKPQAVNLLNNIKGALLKRNKDISCCWESTNPKSLHLPLWRSGFQVIYRNLLKMFLTQSKLGLTTQLALPMLAKYFVRKILIPETALGLISQDLSLAISDPLV
ncbi:uncharacterized protein VP01_3914g3 [Puccinia sorghi]|uniref:Uncharacterized protein n=1 Tax=Puccinia sorghi TaxID=27349 RepID=A0A0L6USL1_9BASI|nr:uncharacterized protein VP01_3914g3 [Puccinia sorghi]